MSIDPRIAITFTPEKIDLILKPLALPRDIRVRMVNCLYYKSNPSYHNLPTDTTLMHYEGFANIILDLAKNKIYPVTDLPSGDQIFRGCKVVIKPPDIDLLGIGGALSSLEKKFTPSASSDFLSTTIFSSETFDVPIIGKDIEIPYYIGSYQCSPTGIINLHDMGKPTVLVLVMLPNRKFIVLLAHLTQPSTAGNRFLYKVMTLFKADGKLIAHRVLQSFISLNDVRDIECHIRVASMALLDGDYGIPTEKFDICEHGLSLSEVRDILQLPVV